MPGENWTKALHGEPELLRSFRVKPPNISGHRSPRSGFCFAQEGKVKAVFFFVCLLLVGVLIQAAKMLGQLPSVAVLD